MTWCVYILECKNGTLYTGITNDIRRRIRQHTLGTGAKYTRGKGPFNLIYKEKCLNRSEAQRREIKIKKLARKNKFNLTILEPHLIVPLSVLKLFTGSSKTPIPNEMQQTSDLFSSISKKVLMVLLKLARAA